MQGKGDAVLALSGNGKALLIKADLTAVQYYVLATAYGVALAIGLELTVVDAVGVTANGGAHIAQLTAVILRGLRAY